MGVSDLAWYSTQVLIKSLSINLSYVQSRETNASLLFIVDRLGILGGQGKVSFLLSDVLKTIDFIDNCGWHESYIMITVIQKCDDNKNYNSDS